MNLLTQNSKIKQTSSKFSVRLFNFGIPAYKSGSGEITCPMAGSCIKFCYAKKGAFTWPNVKRAYNNRYELSKTDKFVPKINADIVIKEPEYVRIHDSGDFYSAEYLDKWRSIAIHNPHVRFYAYTNCIRMVKNADLPDNLDVIFSDSGRQSRLIDQDNDRHTKIFKSIEDLKQAGYADASKYDLYATKWFSKNNKIGLVMH